MTLEFCPRCGAGRTGAFRYCRSCGFDFEGPAVAATCPRCGTRRTAAFRYCRTCGLDFEVPAAAATPPAASPAMAAAVPVGVARPVPSSPVAPLAASPPTSPGSREATNWSGVVVLIGGGIIALGSFLPWVSATAPFIGTVSRNGFDGGGDGVMTLIAGGLVALGGIGMLAQKVSRTAAIVLTLAGAAVGAAVEVIGMANVQSGIDTITASVPAAIGVGLVVIPVGVGISVVGLFFPRGEPR